MQHELVCIKLPKQPQGHQDSHGAVGDRLTVPTKAFPIYPGIFSFKTPKLAKTKCRVKFTCNLRTYVPQLDWVRMVACGTDNRRNGVNSLPMTTAKLTQLTSNAMRSSEASGVGSAST